MNARSALDAARPVLARMDLSRGPDAGRADLIEVWSAVESALRSLVGTDSQSGQSLIRDARSRQLLTFDQANALVALLAVREQLDVPTYQPTDSDLTTARSAFLKLDAGLMSAPTQASQSPAFQAESYGSPAPKPYMPPGSKTSTPPVVPPAPSLEPLMTSPRKRRLAVPLVITLVVILALGIPAVFLYGRGSGSDVMAQGITAYQRGDKVTAASDFERAARATPNDAMPHVYLARMAREVGNFTVANQELQLALKAQPTNLTARREYGSFFLSQGNNDQARVWYTHALEVDANDLTSQGWLGCSLVKLGRVDEGTRWMSRAGNGPWSACRTPALPSAPGTIRP